MAKKIPPWIIGTAAIGGGLYVVSRTQKGAEIIGSLGGGGFPGFPDLSFIGDIFSQFPTFDINPLTGLQEQLSGFIDAAKENINDGFTTAKETLTEIKDAPINAVNEIKDGIIKTGSEIKAAGVDAKNTAVDYGKAGALGVTGGAILTGTFAGAGGFLAAGFLGKFIGEFFRKKGIRRDIPGGYEIVAPETAIGDFFKNLNPFKKNNTTPALFRSSSGAISPPPIFSGGGGGNIFKKIVEAPKQIIQVSGSALVSAGNVSRSSGGGGGGGNIRSIIPKPVDIIKKFTFGGGSSAGSSGYTGSF